MSFLQILAVCSFLASFWLSNKSYDTEDDKRLGWRIAMALFCLAPVLLWF